MITAITFQWMHNVKYSDESHRIYHSAGDRYITDLVELLNDNMAHMERLRNIVTEINTNLESCVVQEIICNNTNGQFATVTHKTKKKRTYYWGGLTIHEEDK